MTSRYDATDVHAARGHTVAMLRMHRKIGTNAKRTRMPASKYPHLIESDYGGRLAAIVDHQRELVKPLIAELPRLLASAAKARTDAANAGQIMEFAGFPVVVENIVGSERYWTQDNGAQGFTVMKYAYGYIDGVMGVDGEEVDVYLGPEPDAKEVYVVHQHTPQITELNRRASAMYGLEPRPTWSYDEDKAMLGFTSLAAARDAYVHQYNDERFLGSIEAMSVDAFRRALIASDGGAITNRSDAGESRRAQQLVDAARHRLVEQINPTALERLAQRYALETSKQQKAQLAKQARAKLGIDVATMDRKIPQLIEHYVGENVSLIKTLGNETMDSVEKMVTRAITTGTRHEELADDIMEEFDVAERHARLIARDQIGKLNGQITAARHQELGLTRFIWRTVGDERVRDTHDDFEKESEQEPFSYDDPPEEDGEQVLPGEPICCRCSAEPVFDDILDAADSADDEDATDGESAGDSTDGEDRQDEAPGHQEKPWSCGPASLVNVCSALGLDVPEARVREYADADAEGTDERQLLKAAGELGLRALVIHSDDAEQSWSELLASVAQGEPCLLCIDAWDHWVAVVGVVGDRVIMLDSSNSDDNVAVNGIHVMTAPQLIARWQHKDEERGLYAIAFSRATDDRQDGFNPDQERDERGRFGSGGGAAHEEVQKEATAILPKPGETPEQHAKRLAINKASREAKAAARARAKGLPPPGPTAPPKPPEPVAPPPPPSPVAPPPPEPIAPGGKQEPTAPIKPGESPEQHAARLARNKASRDSKAAARARAKGQPPPPAPIAAPKPPPTPEPPPAPAHEESQGLKFRAGVADVKHAVYTKADAKKLDGAFGNAANTGKTPGPAKQLDIRAHLMETVAADGMHVNDGLGQRSAMQPRFVSKRWVERASPDLGGEIKFEKLGRGVRGVHYSNNGLIKIDKETAKGAASLAHDLSNGVDVGAKIREGRMSKGQALSGIGQHEYARQGRGEQHQTEAERHAANASDYRTFVHEQIHGAGPASMKGGGGSYRGIGVVVEEVSTEVSARRITREKVGLRHGDVQTLSRPEYPGAPGSYNREIYGTTRSVADAVRSTGLAAVDHSQAYEMVERASHRYKSLSRESVNNEADTPEGSHRVFARSFDFDHLEKVSGRKLDAPARDKIVGAIERHMVSFASGKTIY